MKIVQIAVLNSAAVLVVRQATKNGELGGFIQTYTSFNLLHLILSQKPQFVNIKYKNFF